MENQQIDPRKSVCTISVNNVLETMQKSLCDPEGAMSHFFPKIEILLPMIAGSWCVADDAETHKRTAI